MDAEFEKFLKVAWSRLEKCPYVYLLTTESGLPYTLAPELVDQEPYLTGRKKEASMMVFLDEADGEAWGAMALEIFEDEKKLPKLTMVRKSLQELFEWIDEINVLCQKEYGHPVKIDVCSKFSDTAFAIDLLYSSYVPKQ